MYRLSCSTAPRLASLHSRPARSWYVVWSRMTWVDRAESRTCTASAWRRRARSRSARRIHRCRKWSACSPPARWRSRSFDLPPNKKQIRALLRRFLKVLFCQQTLGFWSFIACGGFTVVEICWIASNVLTVYCLAPETLHTLRGE